MRALPAAGKLPHLFCTNDGNLQDYKLIKTHCATFSQQFVFPPGSRRITPSSLKMCTLPVICEGGSWPASQPAGQPAGQPASESEDQFLGKCKQTHPYKLPATSGTASATPPPCFPLQPQLLQSHWADAEMCCPTYSISSVLPHVQKENKLALATYQLNF